MGAFIGHRVSGQFLIAASLAAGVFMAAEAFGQNGVQSLKDVPIPEPANLYEFVSDKPAAIALGKALFWDMQVGSDNVLACASCHFNAGADDRSKNQLSPGLLDQITSPGGDRAFGNSPIGKEGNPAFGPNYTLKPDDFPLHKREPATEKVPRPELPDFAEVGPEKEFANVLRDTNDVVSSQGIRLTQFVDVRRGNLPDRGVAKPDPVFQAKGPLRRVEPRNAPTTINSVFHFDNFWDGRASVIFNGVNPFGFRDTQSTLKKAGPDGALEDVLVRIPNASLASQAVGPPLSDFEMSFAGRSFPLLGRKLLSRRPLARQIVHPNDSVLGPLSRARLVRGRVMGPRGLNVRNYEEMVKKAFREEWWNSNRIIEVLPGTEAVKSASAQDPRSFVASSGQATVSRALPGAVALRQQQFTQMEWNFSLFFGLAVQLYEATLVSDDTPYDRFVGASSNLRGDGPIAPDPAALTDQEKLGMEIFFGTNDLGLNEAKVSGRCNNCHLAPEFTNASVRHVKVDADGVPRDVIEPMRMGDGKTAFYDSGFYNIGSRPSTEDIARAATAPDLPPFRNPLMANQPFPLSYVELALLKKAGNLPEEVARFVPDMPQQCAAGFFMDEETGQCNLPAPVNDRVAVRGSFKTPSLRNIEFSGPYLHNGSEATLRQVIDFYTRGGNFPATNFNDLDPDMEGVPGLDPTQDPDAQERIDALVAFLTNGLTDSRVKFERAPFDHPQLFIPAGALDRNARRDLMVELPPVGQEGRAAPIPRFLNLDPQTP